MFSNKFCNKIVDSKRQNKYANSALQLNNYFDVSNQHRRKYRSKYTKYQLNDLRVESMHNLEHINVNSSQFIQGLEEAQVQDKIYDPVKDDDLCKHIENTRQNLFKNIILGMKKNTRCIYEQFADRLNETMVKIVAKNEEAEENTGENLVKLCVIIICPTCSAILGAPLIVSDGTKVNYYTLSAFHKHMRAHMKKIDQNLSMKKLSAKSQNQKKKRQSNSKLTKTKPQKRQKQITTSSDSDENEELARELEKEVAKNLTDEIDDIVSDLEVSFASVEEDTLEDTSTYQHSDIPSSSLTMPHMPRHMPKLRKIGNNLGNNN